MKRRRIQPGDVIEFWEHKPNEAILLGTRVVKYVDSRNKQVVLTEPVPKGTGIGTFMLWEASKQSDHACVSRK